MRLAFYAPLKPTDHPTPSGDRAMARGVIAALLSLGYIVDQPSALRSRDGDGDASNQAALLAQADLEVIKILALDAAKEWRAWITYHNYYKAPDLIGPNVAKQLGIPYLQIEATRARKRLTGPWALFAAKAEAASDAASVIFYVTERDAEALRRDAPPGQLLLHLRPFLNLTELPRASARDGPMLTVGMMRQADKLASYQIIAETLAHLKTNWQLTIAGDGPARAEVAALMAPFGDRVTFLGRLDATALAATYGSASLFFWPGVNEAFGLSYLEAQAHGLPVIAQDRPGVRDVLAPGPHPTPDAGAPALAKRLEHLLSDQTVRKTAGDAARDFVTLGHLLPTAAQTLRSGLEKAAAL